MCRGSFLAVKRLYIKVPAKVSWHEVMFSTTGTLGLLFMDPKRFAKDAANVCAMCSLLAGPSLLDVIRCWAAQNRPWSSTDKTALTGKLQFAARYIILLISVVVVVEWACLALVCQGLRIN
jgi:hypothetical protein